MYIEEEVDPFNLAPGLAKRHSDPLRQTRPTLDTYPPTPTHSTSACDSMTYPPSVQRAWDATQANPHDPPMPTASTYIQNPHFPQPFTAGPVYVLQLNNGAINASHSNPSSAMPNSLDPSLTDMSTNPFTPLPPPPTTPPGHLDASLRTATSPLSYSDRSAHNFASFDVSIPLDGIPRTSAGSGSSPLSSSPVTPITCSICHTPFNGEYAPGNLKRHFRTSHGNIKSICEAEECQREFRRSDARREHYKKHHPELL